MLAGEFLGKESLTVAAAAAAAVVFVGAVVAAVAVVAVVVVVVVAAAAAAAAATATAAAGVENVFVAAQEAYYSPTSKPYSAKMFALRSTGYSVSKRKPEVGGIGSCSRGQKAERKVL